MTTAVFVAPFLLDATLRFVAAAAALPEVRLALISQDPEERLPQDLQARLAAHCRIDDGVDAQQIADATRIIGRHLGGVDHIVAMLEQLQVPLGEVRDALGIPGMSAAVASNFRDKARMKSVLEAHGIPCARHGLAASAGEVRRVAADLGFPLVVKPPAGAGARGTFRIEGEAQLAQWLEVDPPSQQEPALLEQHLTGEEHSFDSVMVDGALLWHSITRYLPSPLEVLENPWIQWAVILPRDIETPEFDGIRAAAHAGLRALGMRTGMSHMEWFRLNDNGVAISEVGARPPGAQFTSLLSYAHDVDMYSVWARLEILASFTPLPRRYAVGAAYLRGQGTGAVRAVHGLDTLQHELGDLVVEARLPRAGQPRAITYEGDGYVIVRHPDTGVVEDALRRIVDVARVEVAQS